MKKYLKNISKYIVCTFLIAITAVFATVPVSAAENGLADVSLVATKQLADGTTFSYAFHCHTAEVSAENRWLLSMPSYAENTQTTLQLRGDSISIDGKNFSSGDTLTALSAGEHKVVYGGTTYWLDVFYASEIPSVFINTENGMEQVLADKSHKEGGEIYILSGDSFEYAGVLDYIKGRGNATWTQPKKPFNIKLDEKTNLFNMGKNKGWSLLANYVDTTHLRNITAMAVADAAGLHYTSKYQPVDLWIDNQYYGHYTLIEKVEIGENRVEITNLAELTEEANPDIDIEEGELMGTRGEESGTTKGSYKWVDIPNNPENITGGYLLECELSYRYDNEASGFVSNYGQPMVGKEPEFASKEQVEYIRDYYQQLEDAVLSDDGYNKEGKHYSDYIDVESMARMYVFQEYVRNLDIGKTSFYYYKDVDGKIVASPVWDFDMALGHYYIIGNRNLDDPTDFMATGSTLDTGDYTLVSLLCRHAEFRELAAKVWQEDFVPVTEMLDKYIADLAAYTKSSAVMDKNKWTEGFARTTTDVPQWYGDQVVRLREFMTARADFMDKNFCEDKVYVQYASNGGEGFYLDKTAYDAGNTVEVKENKFTYETEFLGYNTQADGKGTMYMPGDSFEISENTTLYAQWAKKSFFARLADFFANLF